MSRHGRRVTGLALALTALMLAVPGQPALAAKPQIPTSTTVSVTPNDLTLAYQGIVSTVYTKTVVDFSEGTPKRGIKRKLKKLRRRERRIKAAAADCRVGRVVYIFQNGTLVTTATSQFDGSWAATGMRQLPGTPVTVYVQRVDRPQATCAESSLQSTVVP